MIQNATWPQGEMQPGAEDRSPRSEPPLGHLLPLRLSLFICKVGPVTPQAEVGDSGMLCERHTTHSKCSPRATVPMTTVLTEGRSNARGTSKAGVTVFWGISVVPPIWAGKELPSPGLPGRNGWKGTLGTGTELAKYCILITRRAFPGPDTQ